MTSSAKGPEASIAPQACRPSETINYDVLIKEWGSYAVTLAMQVVMTGSYAGPAGAEQLHLESELTGDHLVVVASAGFNAAYPWSGRPQFSPDFSLMAGAVSQGEGWSFTLAITTS